jgi:predicted PolB exonuclease-like 3'-5' exonuclease
MIPLYIDIETIPAQSERLIAEVAANVRPPAQMKKAETIAKWEAEDKPAAIEEALKSTSFDGAYGEIIIIGAAVDNDAIKVFARPEIGAEPDVLEEFFTWLDLTVQQSDRAQIQVVGHNVADFDLRFIWQRAVIQGITANPWMPWHSRPWGDRVYDTMTMWAGVGKRISLDKLCGVLGIARKGTEIGEDIDGSKVWDFWKAKRYEELAAYCAADVSRVREAHARMTFLPARFSN